LQSGMDLLLRFAPPQRILTLERRQRLYRMSASDGRGTGLRHAEVLDLTFPDEVLYCACHIFDGHIRIHTMLIEQIDRVGLQPLQRRMSYGSDPLRIAVGTLGGNSIFEAELGRDHDLVANWGQRVPYDLFVCKRTVCLSGIEKGDSAIVGSANDLDRLVLFG